MKNHYTLLGISPTASAEQIKSAYTNAVISIQDSHDFAIRFAELREAYDTLSNLRTRKIYDAGLVNDFIKNKKLILMKAGHIFQA